MRRCLMRRLALGGLLAVPVAAAAFSSGATVCEVDALPFAPMAAVLRQPPPSGWEIVADARVWHPAAVRSLRLQHPDPSRRLRGVLLWVKGSRFGSPTGAGRFLDLGVANLYGLAQGTPPEDCGEWAITHRSAEPKSQGELVFAWQAPEAGWGSLIARAFVIEDCAETAGVCRDAQALTAFFPLRETGYYSGFE